MHQKFRQMSNEQQKDWGWTVGANILLNLCQCCLSDMTTQPCMAGEPSAIWAQFKDVSDFIGR